MNINKSTKLKDAGEVVLGARKHIFADFAKFQQKDFSLAATLKKADLPKIDFKKLHENNETTDLVTVLCSIYQHVPRRTTGRNAYIWERNFLETINVIKLLLSSNSEEGSELLDIVRKHRADGFRNMYDKVKLGLQIGFPGVINLGPCEISYANVAHFWYYKGPDGRTDYDSKFQTEEEVLNGLRERLIEVYNDTKTPAARKKAKYKIHVLQCDDELFIGWLSARGTAVKLKTGFTDVDTAQQYLKDNLEALEIQLSSLKAEKDYWLNGKTEFVRTGKTWTDETFISSEELLNKLNFRGVQYGNQMTLSDKEKVNLRCLNAIHDLAEIIGLEPEELTGKGTLAIAFGARGKAKGKLSACAHYELIDCIINLTRSSKRGNLSHELFHYWDNLLGSFSEKGQIDVFQNETFATTLFSPIKGRTHLPEEVIEAICKLIKEIYNTDVVGRSFLKDDLRSKPYWSKRIEVLARCFEMWVFTELEKRGQRNDFLVSFNFDHETEEDYPYPTRKEMEKGINDAFKNLFSVLSGEHKKLFF